MKNRFLVSLLMVLLIFTSFVSAGGGGASVPVKTEELTFDGKEYISTPTRLKFEFDGNPYAVQLRRVKQDHADFIVMTLDKNKPDDILAYTLDYSFTLKSGEEKEIDLDKDGKNDLLVKLNDLGLSSKSIRSASFLIQKINFETQSAVADHSVEIQGNTTDSGEEMSSSTDNIIVIRENGVNFESPSLMIKSDSKTIFERIFSFFKTLF